jgi:hypothetical protein
MQVIPGSQEKVSEVTNEMAYTVSIIKEACQIALKFPLYVVVGIA